MKTKLKLIISALLFVSTFSMGSYFAGEPDPTKTTIEAFPQIVITGTTSRIIINLKDSLGRPILGVAESEWSINHTGPSAVGTPSPTGGLGEYRFEVEYNNNTNEDVSDTYTITVKGVELNPITVTFKKNGIDITYGVPHKGNSSISIDKDTIIANNSDFATVTIKVRDDKNRPVQDPNLSITLKDTLKGTDVEANAIFTLISSNTQQATFTYSVKSSITEDIDIFAKIIGTNSDKDETKEINIGPVGVNFVPGVVDITKTTLTVDKNSTKVRKVIKATLTLRDANNNIVNNTTHNVNLTLDGQATATNTPCETSTGVCIFDVTDASPESIEIKATIDSNSSLTKTKTVTFTQDIIDQNKSSITAVPVTVVANDVNTSTITVRLRNSNDEPILGANVTLSQESGKSSTGWESLISDLEGDYVFRVKSRVAEEVTYKANLLTNTTMVTFIPDVIDGNKSRLRVDNETPTVGDNVIATLELKDKYGNNIIDKENVTLTATGSAEVANNGGMTNNEDGTYTITFTDNTAESITLSVTVDNVTFTKDVTFRSGRVDENATTVTSNKEKTVVNDIYDVDDLTIITVHVVDISGNVIKDANVGLDSNDSNNTTTISTVDSSDSTNGNYTFKVYSTKAELVEFNAEVNTKVITQKATVLFVPGITDADTSELTTSIEEVKLSKGNTMYVNLILKDRFKNLIKDKDIHNTNDIEVTTTGTLIEGEKLNYGDFGYFVRYASQDIQKVIFTAKVENSITITQQPTTDFLIGDVGRYSKNMLADECLNIHALTANIEYKVYLSFRDDFDHKIQPENGISDILWDASLIRIVDDNIEDSTNENYDYEYKFIKSSFDESGYLNLYLRNQANKKRPLVGHDDYDPNNPNCE